MFASLYSKRDSAHADDSEIDIAFLERKAKENNPVKIIGIEEHFVTADIRAAWAASAIGQEGTGGFDRGEIEERLDDLGEHRLELMDEGGVDVQVLSETTPAFHNLEPEESVTLARGTNDLVAATVAKYSTRFLGFATLPTAAPKEAAGPDFTP